MRYLLDSANLDAVREYAEYYPLDGVTTNPSIVKKEGQIDFFEHMRTIRSIIGKQRTLHVQVTAETAEGMLRDAERIVKEIDDQVYIKIPVNKEGIKAIRLLKEKGRKVTGTAIYTREQGFLAIAAGADYIAPYYNRMEVLGIDSEDVITSFAQIIEDTHSSTQILAASFKNVGQVNKAFLAGAHTATVAPDILNTALAMPSIIKAVDDFNNDWKSIYGDRTIAELS